MMMHIEINNIELQQLLNNIHLSSQHIDQAARFYVKHGLDQSIQQSICEEWFNHFHFSKGNYDGDKIVIALIHMAQKVLEYFTKTEPAYSNMKEAFKKQIQKALNQLKEGQYPPEVLKAVKDIIKQWEEKQIFSKQDISNMIEIVDPVRVDKSKISYPPPNFLINYAKNLKDLQIRITKQQELQHKLDDAIKNGGISLNQYEQILEQYNRSVESVQKYRQLVIKDICDQLKELDKVHFKSIIDLKYIVQRLDELKKQQNQE